MSTTTLVPPRTSRSEYVEPRNSKLSVRPELTISIGLVALVFLAFWPSLGQGFVEWDDQVYFADSAIQGTTLPGERLTFIARSSMLSNYNPLHRISNWLQHILFGGNARGYHLVSILMHAANVLLVFVLARRLGAATGAAAIAAILFAVHPVRAENVAWWSSQKDLGSGFFALIALVLYARILDGETKRYYPRLVGVWVFFLLAIFFKSMLVTLPALLLVLDVAWRRPLLRASIEKVPFFVLSAVFSVLTVDVGPKVQPIGGTWDSHFAVALMAPWHYLARWIAPFDYSARYFVPRPETVASLLPILSLIGLTLIAGVTCWSLRSKHRKWFLLVVGWPAVALAPVLNLVPITTVIADRFLYLAMIGPFFATGVAFSRLVERSARGARPRFALSWSAAVIVIVTGSYTALCWKHSTVFADSETMWRRSLAYQPHNPLARIFFAKTLVQSSDPAEVREGLELVEGIREDQIRASQSVLITRYRGLRALGRNEEAFRVLDEAVQAAEDDGWKEGTAKSVADLHADRGEWAAAHEAIDRAVIDHRGARERQIRTHADFALRAGDVELFLAWNEKALEARPFDVIAWHNHEQIARNAGFEEIAARAGERVDALIVED